MTTNSLADFAKEPAFMPEPDGIQPRSQHASFWMKGIDAEKAGHIALNNMVENILSLLQKLDNVSMDIQITINQNKNI